VNIDLDGKTVIVTGAGRGIGREIAVMAAEANANVVLCARSGGQLEEVAAAIAAKGKGGVLSYPADLTETAVTDELVKATLAKFRGIYALVNNAGTNSIANLMLAKEDDFRAVYELNVFAVFRLTKAVVRQMIRQKSGRVINISSVAAKDPFAGFIAYGAAKAGLNNLGISLAREGEPIGVRVYTIAPGAVETAMFRAILSPEQFPVDNTLRPQEVAQLVADCIKGEARYKSGEVIWISRN